MNDSTSILLKRGVWLYFYLLIFEGALRKWILPELANPLLIIRDPLAIWLLVMVFQHNVWKPNIYVVVMWMLTVMAFILTLLLGHGNIPVALYGFRITAIHFPILFIIGHVFNKEDVLKMGKILLVMNIAMTFLVAMQFFSPQSAWVNRGIGGEMEGSGFGGAAGFMRVPGTFSFTGGLTRFYSLAGAFIFYFWIGENKVKISKWLLIVSSLAFLAAIPLSISRTVLFQVVLAFAFMLAISGTNIRIVKRMAGTVIAGFGLLMILSSFSFFETASMAFFQRFENASISEGGLEGTLIDRFLGGMYGAITDPEASFWGLGLGMGTAVGSQILIGDRMVYLIAEGEWGRLIGEMGVLIGIAVILLRASLVVELLMKSWNSAKNANYLPWMLMSFGALSILQGQLAQPTNLGFTILIGGLVIASLKEKEE